MPMEATRLRDHSILGRGVWLLFPLCFAITIVCFQATGFGFVWSSLAKPMIPAFFAALIFVIYSKYRPDAIICAMSESLLFLFLVGPPLAIMDYPLQSLNFPLRDAEFAAIDHAMGFDWMAHFYWVSAHPLIGQTLLVAYHSCMIQMAAFVVILSYTKRFAHLREFLFLFVATALVVSLVSTILPAIGAFPYYAPPADLRIGNDPMVGIYHLQDELALRGGSMTTVDLAHVAGLVTLPSFHAIFAILLTWATRGIKYLFVPTIILNVIVCISAIAIGGHYLIDIFAGAAIAFAGMAAYAYRAAIKDCLLHSLPETKALPPAASSTA